MLLTQIHPLFQPRHLAGTSIGTLALGSDLFICHSHYYNSALDEWAAGLLAGGLGVITPLWAYKKRWLLRFLLPVFAIALLAGWFVCLTSAKSQYLSRQLAFDGVMGGARVSDFEIKTRRGFTTQYIVFPYQHNALVYYQRVANARKLPFGDSLYVRYSASHPENVVVTGARRQGDFRLQHP
ncbi:DUF3592 domain-containing protein [Hymenobacter algoricola]|uniref:DUF3592 domain-containing protein n=1 Tax=Hymenobacter algoricola TaxID=486267 RepID=A0ABP7NKP3_9BACT